MYGRRRNMQGVIICENQADDTMAKTLTYSRRRRHIELRLHHFRDEVAIISVDLSKVKTDYKFIRYHEQAADP